MRIPTKKLLTPFNLLARTDKTEPFQVQRYLKFRIRQLGRKVFFVAGEERAEVSAGEKEIGHILKIHPLSYSKRLFYFIYNYIEN